MATEAQLISALRQADAAGDRTGAQRIAQIIRAQRGTPQSSPVSLGGLAKSFGSAALNAALSLSPQAMGNEGQALGYQLAGGLAKRLGINPQKVDQAVASMQAQRRMFQPTPEEAQQAAGLYHAPQNEAERVSGAIGSMLPNAFLGGGGLVARALRVAIPALASEGARAGAEAVGGGPVAQTAASVGGAMLGGHVAANPASVPQAAMRATLGARNPVSPQIAALADRAINEHDIPLQSWQIEAAGASGNRQAAIRGSNLIASNPRFAAARLAQKKAFTAAVAKTFGANTDSLTVDQMAAARKNLSDRFEALKSQTGVAADDQLITDLAQVGSNARELGLPDNEVSALDKQIAKITDLAASHEQSGIIPGDAYQSLTESGSALSKIMSSAHGSYGGLGEDIKNALDSAASRVSPEANDALATLRQQWANLKTVEPLAEKAGPEGLISPPLLQGRVNATFDNAAYGSGADLKELGDIGQTFLKEPGNSQTAPRFTDKLKSPAAVAGLLGETYLATHSPGAAAAAAGTAATAYGLSKAANAFRAAQSDNPIATAQLLGNSMAPPRSVTMLDLSTLAPGTLALSGAQPSPGQ